MLDAISTILEQTSGMSYLDFLRNKIVIDAALYNIIVIGEAAAHVPDEVQDSSPSIPWSDIRGMRHRLVHAYYQTDPYVVWDTITNDLELLAPLLRELLESDIPPLEG